MKPHSSSVLLGDAVTFPSNVAIGPFVVTLTLSTVGAKGCSPLRSSPQETKSSATVANDKKSVRVDALI